MVTADLGACEWFVYELRRSNLIDRGQLDQVVGEFLKRTPRGEPEALAEFLIEQGALSQFQAERILGNKAQGLVLGPYVLMDAIGSGSMGTVYKASNKTDSQLYAVKVLPRRSMWNVRLARRQVRAFGQFSHPSVVPFTDVGTAGGMHYLVWPLVEGETLESVVQRSGRLTPDVTALIGLQAAHGLTACHARDLFHGLLKPSNVMVGADHVARILDFGIGSLLVENEGESLVDTMSTANTLTSGLDCASPESIMEPTNRTPAGDQYSLGCVLYFCLTGRCPFPDGSAVEKMMAHQFKQPTPLAELAPDTPPALVAVVERLMQKTPEARYGGADEIVEALRPLAPELSARALAEPRVAPAPAPGGRLSKSLRSGTVNTPAPGASTGRLSTPRANSAAAPAPSGRTARPSSSSRVRTGPSAPAAYATPPYGQPAAETDEAEPLVNSEPKPRIPSRQCIREDGGATEAVQPAAPQGFTMPPGFVEEEKPRHTHPLVMFVAVGMVVMTVAYLMLTSFPVH